MNIVVIGRCEPEPNSSYGKFEFEQARALAQRGNNVCYLYSDNRSIKYIHSFKRIDTIKDGIRLVGSSAPFGGIPYGLFDFLKSKSLCREFQKICDSGMKPDVVYAHFPLISMAPRFLEWLTDFKIPVVTMEHWTKVRNKTIDGGRREFLKSISNKVHAMCCVSDDLAIAISELTGKSVEDIIVIPNIVNNETFYYNRKQRTDDTVRYIWSGRLEKNKSVDLILRALSLADYPWKFIVAGTGSEELTLKRTAEKLGIADKVQFIGWVSSKELGELYRQSDCFVSASSDETFCVPFAEAWMCGLSCIGAKSNPLRKLFSELNGALFENGSIDSLYSQLIYVRNQLPTQDGRKIAEWARSLFSSSEVIKTVEGVLASAVKEDCSSIRGGN